MTNTRQPVCPTEIDILRQIEDLHRVQLAAGALAHTPPGFLTSFYRYLASRPDCVVVAVRSYGQVVGFVAGTTQASGLLKAFLIANPLQFVSFSMVLLRKPRLLRRVLLLLSHLTNRADQTVSDRQLLAIAVAPGSARAGIGSQLFEALCDWFRQREITEFDIIASKTQGPALSFYARRGAREIASLNLGGLDSVVFRHLIPSTARCRD